MSIFPLHKRPAVSYKESPRGFASLRDKGLRQHAGCDLYAPAGTPVLAVEDGKVLAGPYLFYDVVLAIEVLHPSGIFRYGEISGVADGIKPGAEVKAGQVIGYVGKMQSVSQSMLHLEMFKGTANGRESLSSLLWRTGFLLAQQRTIRKEAATFSRATEVRRTPQRSESSGLLPLGIPHIPQRRLLNP